MSDLDLTSLKDVRDEEGCKNCRNCDFIRECEGCGVKFCSKHIYEEGDWAHNKNGDVLCPCCRQIYLEDVDTESLTDEEKEELKRRAERRSIPPARKQAGILEENL